MSTVGHHYIWDIYDCVPEKISHIPPIQQLMQSVIDASKLTIIKEAFNQFAPHGVTGIFLLEESHLSAHSWPEHGYLALDLFSCVPLANLEEISHLIKVELGNCRVEFKTIARGSIIENVRRTHSHH